MPSKKKPKLVHVLLMLVIMLYACAPGRGSESTEERPTSTEKPPTSTRTLEPEPTITNTEGPNLVRTAVAITLEAIRLQRTMMPSPTYTISPNNFVPSGCGSPQDGILAAGDEVEHGWAIPGLLSNRETHTYYLSSPLVGTVPASECHLACARHGWTEYGSTLTITIIETGSEQVALSLVGSTWNVFNSTGPANTQIGDEYTGAQDNRFLAQFIYVGDGRSVIDDVLAVSVENIFILMTQRFEAGDPILHWETADVFDGLVELEYQQLKKICPVPLWD
jgi:hypothetical protein